MFKNINKKLIFTLIFTIALVVVGFVAYQMKTASAYSCERTYGGGLNCDRRIRIKKEVRLNDDESFKETISGVKKGQVFTFRIEVINNGDVDIKDLDVIDELPKELEVVEASELGSNLKDTIEVLDNSDDSDVKGCTSDSNGVKVYCFRAKIKDSAFNGMQKCVVNLVRLKGDFNDDENKETLATDTAIVCFGETLKELPKTGSEETIAYTILGLGMFLTGLVVKRFV